ncbi:hypothetical protein E3N88_13015 [Mikania micrantha]|uniref:S1-like domain-containing protein n=1 Tax=Mikania micrantha TaxID=192012 RepID=A0A5N6PA38_9ASTR|nr:hypothetical protein E3N88_13015 [Mikania micrantha]
MATKGGRKNLKRAVNDETLILQPGQSIMQVVSLRGSNLIEVLDAKGEKALAIFPAKFQKSMWIKRGSFVVVDDGGREEAIESGRKVACVVLQVLFHEQVRVLRKSPECEDDDGLPPLEANTNRRVHVAMQSATDSDSDTEDSKHVFTPPKRLVVVTTRRIRDMCTASVKRPGQ